LSHVSDPRRTGEDRLEELPAIGRCSRQVDSELAQNTALSGIARVGHERAAELPPTGGEPNVDQAPNPALPEG